MAHQMTKLEQAKARLCTRSVFFPMLIMSTPIDPDETLPTMATDGVSIWYNTNYVDQQEIDVIISLLVHEIMHIILRHCIRRGKRDPQLWNMAADFAVNAVLMENGFQLWQGALYNRDFAGMTAETIYDILAKDASKRPSKPDTAGEDLKEPKNLTDEKREQIEQNVRGRVAQAATQARMAGQMSDGLERLVGEMMTAKIPWEQVLLEFMQSLVAELESWNRRNRRMVDLFLPAKHNTSMGPLTIICDTSGSIGDDTFKMVLGEITYIAEAVQPELIRIVWCDSQVHGEQVFEKGDEIKLIPRGGGGTDMRVALTHVEQYEPVVVILITDGYTPWPRIETDYPLLVLCTTEVVPPIGTTIYVKT